MRPKTITLFLKDGEPRGRIKCTLANWTGLTYKIPRTMIAKSKDISELNYSGVYFLFGTDQDDNPVVYVGQAGLRKTKEGLLTRIQEPHKSIDYWTEAVVFTTSSNYFSSTEIYYLENQFYLLAKQANRYIIKNDQEPSDGNPTEEKKSELDEYIDYAKIVMGALGYNVFEPYISSNDETEDEPLLFLKYNNAKATGKRTSEGFVVLKGSTINPNINQSCPLGAKNNRKKYMTLIDENFTLIADILFASPSAAADFIGGTSLSGNKTWKDKTGKKLGDILNNSNL